MFILAHHWVYETSGILHRDISVGNIMLYRDTASIVGVLCDWDLAYDTLTSDGEARIITTEFTTRSKEPEVQEGGSDTDKEVDMDLEAARAARKGSLRIAQDDEALRPEQGTGVVVSPDRVEHRLPSLHDEFVVHRM